MKSLVLMAIAATVLGVAATWAIADVSPGSAATSSTATTAELDDDSSSSDDNQDRGIFGNRRSSRNGDILDVIFGRGSSDGDSDDDSSGDGWNDSQRNDRGGVILGDGSVVIDRDGRVILRPRRN